MRGNPKLRHPWLFKVLADVLAVVVSYYLTLAIRFYSPVGEWVSNRAKDLLGLPDVLLASPVELHRFYEDNAGRIILFLAITLCLLYSLLDLYSGRRFIRSRPDLWDILRANAIALLLFYAYFYLSRNVFHPRSFFLLLLLLNSVLTSGFRAGVRAGLQAVRRRSGFDTWRVLLCGPGVEADWIEQLISRHNPHGYRIADRFDRDTRTSFGEFLDLLDSRLREDGVDTLIVADRHLSVGEIMQVLEIADRYHLPTKILSDGLEVLAKQARMPVDLIRGVPLVHFEGRTPSRALALLRQARTLLAAVSAGLFLLPVMGLIALLIRLTSHGPALFCQERIGVNRQPFRMYKFRTMHTNAEEQQAQLEEFNESGGGLFKIRDDPRVTPVGKVLRRFSLDEMPQLFNVLRGEMAIVGPRPLPRRDFENYYEDWHYSRHEGMPGLTCLWQVSGRSDLDFHDMCILDVYYLRNSNWVLDLKIILRTIWVVLFAKGAY